MSSQILEITFLWFFLSDVFEKVYKYVSVQTEASVKLSKNFFFKNLMYFLLNLVGFLQLTKGNMQK